MDGALPHAQRDHGPQGCQSAAAQGGARMSGVIEPGAYMEFVWISYALTALGVGGLLFFILQERSSAKRHLKREEDEAGE
ncbi:MAG: heme exporter protein CcmD [Rhodobacterales bacterium CG15_BIG_FIL_POST_REV_8_21_14_020_59_13]|nr:MAG: heme exporter protein CcmD [Rhodobacterales bacterium CG15_BIG_FIL_POST_REV_8_21_14_020_59_13]